MDAPPFELRFFSANLPADTTSVRIYINGDGRAFINRRVVAQDPTPSDHLALKLALVDPAAGGLLARPCYYGGATEAPCSPLLWTADRYSPAVIDSMVTALRAIGERFPQAGLTLVGYSGGGVIALLAARQYERVTRVVTIAAPLDTDAWTRQHAYTPLSPGTNPAAITDWPPRLEQVHLSGGRDTRVPAAITESFIKNTGSKAPGVVHFVYRNFDHDCCWLQAWPGILRELDLN